MKALHTAAGALAIVGGITAGFFAGGIPFAHAYVADPYSTSGTWLVPTEIASGSYRAVSNDGSGTGYYKVCADYACRIGTPGFIDNDFFTGSAIMVVPPNAVSVELNGVALTRLG